MSDETRIDQKTTDQNAPGDLGDVALSKVVGGALPKQPTLGMEAEDTDEFRPRPKSGLTP